MSGRKSGNLIPLTGIRIPPELKAKIQELGKSDNRNFNETVLEALKLYIDWHE